MLLLAMLSLCAVDLVPAQERTRPGYIVHLGGETAAAQAAALVSPPAQRDGLHALGHNMNAPSPEIGDTRDFNVRRFLNQGWRAVNFTLVARDESLLLWVATQEWTDGQVSDADATSLVEALTRHTPEGSFNPNAGILANNQALFGEVPDYDGDGLVDILWYDIRDEYPSDAPLVGYVTLEDLDPSAPPGVGNQADVLYLDTDPLLVGEGFGVASVQAVAAGLHQVLIHYNYDRDELPFVQFGLFEWAKQFNGYAAAEPLYFRFPGEHNLPLFSWNNGPADGERAALFTLYLVEQLGHEAAGLLTREPANGAAGFETVLAARGAARSLPDLVLDFHTANLVNEVALDPRFGYTTPQRRDLNISPSRRIDAGVDEETPPTAVSLTGGGMQYLRWENVEDLRLTLEGVDPARRDRLRVRALLEPLEGSRSVIDLTPGPTPSMLTGAWERVTVAVVDAIPEEDATVQTPLTYAATWTGSAVPVLNLAYDDARSADEGPNFLRLSREAHQATRFVLPAGTQLAKVFIAPYFLNQFTDNGQPLGSPADPRDFTLEVRDDDGHGGPGGTRFTLEITDPRPFAFVTSFALDFLEVDLTGHPELVALPDTVYVGLANAGDDDNTLVLVVSTYTVENVSFLLEPGVLDWTPLWDVAAGGRALENRVVPIRVQVRLPEGSVDAEDEPAWPSAVVLHPNYPNPFNPATTIRYEVPVPAPVRLAVHDVLGRRVAVLVDGWQPAGTYAVPLDAAHWAAGVYFYTLDAGGHRRTRMMTLVK